MNNKKIYFGIALSVFVACLLLLIRTINIGNGNDLRVGAILPLSGSAAAIGEWHKNGLLLAVDSINTESKQKIQLFLEDSRNEGKTGVNAIKSLGDKNCSAFISAMSGVSIPIVPIVLSINKPLFVTSVSYPGFTSLGKNVFRYNVTSDKEAELMGKYLIDNEITKINVIYINDEYGLGAVNSLKRTLNNSAISIVYEESFERNQLDFKNIIDNSISSELFYVIGYGSSYVSLIKTIFERTNCPLLLTVYSMDFKEYRKPLEGQKLKVIYTGVKEKENNAELAKFDQLFLKKYGVSPNLVNYWSYDLLNLINKCWEISSEFNLSEIIGKPICTSVLGYDLIIDDNREIGVPIEIKTINFANDK